MALDTAAQVAILRSLTVRFELSVKAATPMFPTLATIVPSSGRNEEYGGAGSVPPVREWTGERNFATPRAFKFTIENKLWDLSEAIEKTDLEDDRMGIYFNRVAKMANRQVQHPDELIFDLLINGDTQEAFDGQNFFDTDHEWGDSGVQSNLLNADAVEPDAPTEAEFKTAYNAARSALKTYKDDNGQFFVQPTLMPNTNLLLLVPTTMEVAATDAINKALTGGGDTNIVLDRPIVRSSAFLNGDADTFYLLDLDDINERPFIFQERRQIQSQIKGFDDRERKDVLFMTDRRDNVGYWSWWRATRTQFTTP